MFGKRVAAGVLAAACVGLLAGCDSGLPYKGNGAFGGKATVKPIEADGVTVDCLFLGHHESLVMSCDWANARREAK